jgi:hypothetical protein
VSARPRRLGALPLLLLALGGLISCRNLDRFNTEGTAAYCGAIVGTPGNPGAPPNSETPPFNIGFIPSGAPPNLELGLKIDTSALTTRPGSLSSNDAVDGFCKPAPLFDNAPLRAIPELFHDALSQADLGEGHQHTFFAWVDSTCEMSMLAVVSLLTNGAVEVRLLRPGPDLPPVPDVDESKGPGFALFYLQRSETGCGF